MRKQATLRGSLVPAVYRISKACAGEGVVRPCEELRPVVKGIETNHPNESKNREVSAGEELRPVVKGIET